MTLLLKGQNFITVIITQLPTNIFILLVTHHLHTKPSNRTSLTIHLLTFISSLITLIYIATPLLLINKNNHQKLLLSFNKTLHIINCLHPNNSVTSIFEKSAVYIVTSPISLMTKNPLSSKAIPEGSSISISLAIGPKHL